MSKNIFVALIFIVCSFGADSQTVSASADSSDAQKRHDAYIHINHQIFASHDYKDSGQMPEKQVPSATRQLHEMISKEIALALSAQKPSEKDITSAISALQGDMRLADSGSDMTNTPLAKFFTLNGVKNVALAYVILQGGDAIPDTQTYLDFYDNASGVWTKKATAPTLADFAGCSFSVAQLNSGLPGEAWFIAWGMPFGSSHASHHVRLYSFDGFTVHTIWKRDNLDGLRIKVTPDSVTLVYQDFDDVSIEHHQLFHVTGNGLELSSATQRRID